ncbi:putative phage abortive infection protein [Paenibacillus sedimenti]|uniref:Phage abortive infection protein n=1 Tax=Paenibacillus sedimenti TaxID=2770274 RepID=A0A926KSC4_9BACL|nr:putative phage abortive infection protein [Paenibacillus sedimenti]MBD0382428.1 hypothetical protein [Paenibacillus sedimenti]
MNATMKRYIRVIAKRNRILTGLAFTSVAIGLLIPVLILVINNLYRAGYISPYLQQIFLEVYELGTIGDWIGGSAAPLLNLATFVILLVSLNYQRVDVYQSREEHKTTLEDLKESRDLAKEQGKLVKQQKFETTFFNLLNIFFGMAKDAKDSFSSNIAHDLFMHIFMKSRANFLNNEKQLSSVIDTQKTELEREYDIIKESIQPLFKMHRTALEPYMGSMHSVLRSIHSLENKADQLNYLKIFMSHLSGYEVVWLFYFRLSCPNKHLSQIIEELRIFNFLPHQYDGVTAIEDEFLFKMRHKEMFSAFDRTMYDFPRINPVEPPEIPMPDYPDLPIVVPSSVSSDKK